MDDWVFKRKEESFSEYQGRYFQTLSRRAKIVGREEFDCLYAPVVRAYGIRSPAFVNTRAHEIVICDEVPDAYFIGFMLVHEMWEDYVVNKSGFNLRLYEY